MQIQNLFILPSRERIFFIASVFVDISRLIHELHHINIVHIIAQVHISHYDGNPHTNLTKAMEIKIEMGWNMAQALIRGVK